jgi:hypothetical protein
MICTGIPVYIIFIAWKNKPKSINNLIGKFSYGGKFFIECKAMLSLSDSPYMIFQIVFLYFTTTTALFQTINCCKFYVCCTKLEQIQLKINIIYLVIKNRQNKSIILFIDLRKYYVWNIIFCVNFQLLY